MDVNPSPDLERVTNALNNHKKGSLAKKSLVAVVRAADKHPISGIWFVQQGINPGWLGTRNAPLSFTGTTTR
jgi:hypothetical protein